MPGPRNEALALAWIREAVRMGRYTPADHFGARMTDPRLGAAVNIMQVKGALLAASKVVLYTNDVPRHDGTCWRVTGPTNDGREIQIGIEAYLEAKNKSQSCAR